MAKYLLLAVVLWLGWRMLRPRRKAPVAAPQRRSGKVALQTAVACAHCGVHVPQSEAIQSQGRWYCCAQHVQHDAAQ